jgi:hypothetical protein
VRISLCFALKLLHAVALELGDAHHEVLVAFALDLCMSCIFACSLVRPATRASSPARCSLTPQLSVFDCFYFLDAVLDAIYLAVELSLFFVERLLTFKNTLFSA